MDTIVKELCYQDYVSMQTLEQDDYSLLQAAIVAQANAHAPYSNFKVGAAVRLENGEIIVGNNQENAAYPSGLCAERVALFAAAARYPKQSIVALAITAESSNNNEPASPCGACRQVMAEYEHLYCKPMRIILGNAHSHIHIFSKVEHLLPFSFVGEALKK